MDEDVAAVRRYRQHARDVRAMSEQIRDPGVRCALRWIAHDYHTMALSRLRMGKLNRSIRHYAVPARLSHAVEVVEMEREAQRDQERHLSFEPQNRDGVRVEMPRRLESRNVATANVSAAPELEGLLHAS
jgi:hypothetical protein